mgnify:CR=1 FL=1
MGYAYIAKSPAATPSTTPSGWPALWAFPTVPWFVIVTPGEWTITDPPWPPGWPQEEDVGDYSLTVDIPDEETVGATVLTECTIKDDAGADTDALDLHLIAVQFVCEGAMVQCKKLVGDAYADTIVVQATNYSGAKYGFSQALYVDMTGLEGKMLECYAAIVTVDPVVEGNDAGTIVGAPATYNLRSTWNRGVSGVLVVLGPYSRAGKYWDSGVFISYRMRAWRGTNPIVQIPATAITAATLTLLQYPLSTGLDPIGDLKVYLAATGASRFVASTYDVAALPLLATIPQASLTPGGIYTLDHTILNAHAGEDLSLILTTSGEEAGGAAAYLFHDSLVAPYTGVSSSPVVTLTF